MPLPSRDPRQVTVIGGGPAGLMAAEVLAQVGIAVTVYDRMPSVGRKFLMAGRGGLNLTHSEDFKRFLSRYGPAEPELRPYLEAFRPEDLRRWCESLGQETFIGSSGRIFPKTFKASPLLRAWLGRLNGLGVEFIQRRSWQGWNDAGSLIFRQDTGQETMIRSDAVILALGGASWPKLGSDGTWTKLLATRGVQITPLQPANMGFTLTWSNIVRSRFAGEPLKRIALSFDEQTVRGETVITQDGIEGGAIYTLSSRLRQAIMRDGKAVLYLDLRPDFTHEDLASRLRGQRKGQSASTFLRKAAGLTPLGIALLRETGPALPTDPDALAHRIKNVPLTLTGVKAIDRAISSAGGIPFSETDADLMLRQLPGTFVAGEMLDWEAPTGGYLLQAAFATGAAAAKGALAYLGRS